MSHVRTPQPKTRPEWLKSMRAALIATVAVGLVLLAFAWPTATSGVENLPVAVVGSQEQIDAVTQKMPDHLLELHPVANREDAVNGIKSREVYGGIVLGEQPEILTASAASPVASQMLTGVGTNMQRGIDQQVIAGMQQALQKMASGGGAAPGGPGAPGQNGGAASDGTASGGAAQAQRGAGAQQAPGAPGATPPTVKVTDVVPLSDDDPRGSGLAIAGLPLTMGGMIGGVLISSS